MRIYLDLCKKSGLKFLQLKYHIRTTATTQDGRMKPYKGDHIVDWAGYTNDIELFLEDEKNLQIALYLVHETIEWFHLKINVSKTKTMIAHNKYIDENSETYPEIVVSLNVKIFWYIGNNIQFY